MADLAPNAPEPRAADEEAVIERARDSLSGSDGGAAEKLDGLHAVEDELAANDVEAENSPIEEVRAAVPNTDDPDMPCSTGRAWFLGVLFVLLGSGVNIFFSLRYPSVQITSLVAQLVSYPCGCFLAKTLPIGRFNPDRHFNVKEHTLITIMANLAFPYATMANVIEMQKGFMGIDAPAGYIFMSILSTQFLGLAMAGLCSEIFVEPSEMYWPSTLANMALFRTLHSKENPVADGWRISRYRYFIYLFVASFVWYWGPGFLFTALSNFTWICWIAPNNVVVNQLFGQISGLGWSPITFDWAQVAYNNSPLVSPFIAQVNVIIGWAFFYAILPCIIYYKNIWYTGYFQINANAAYDNTGASYNMSRVIDSNGVFDYEAYQTYSPIFLPTSFAICFGVAFALLTCLPVYTILFHGHQIRAAITGQNTYDIHQRLMRRYRDVPKWWYAVILVVCFGIAVGSAERYETGFPVWAIFLAFVLAGGFVIPVSIVMATSNQNVNMLWALGEIIAGFLMRGRPIVNSSFKYLIYTGVSQAMSFGADMKLSTYSKVPKRTTFACQMLAALLSTVVQTAVLTWALNHIPAICTADQPDKFTCPQGRTNFVASVVWGGVGPARLYAVGQRYSGLLHMFWLGALLPLATWAALRRHAGTPAAWWARWLRHASWPLLLGGTANIPPATGINFTAWFLVGAAFNGVARRRRPAWWAKYNYVTSAALDSSVALAGLVIFFAVSYPGASVRWWGTVGYADTADGRGESFYKIPEGGTIGPETW
ncbi:opt family small oligopeptide transporter [Diplodia corticola]|uniref:Opt family small oligopeptide transporter n=1 Tax=Diplodia corticola TaxID=236234 RepID=A0A1J9RPJ5_9PEZI|nr:opt family small oligopeptide transporter [Diplodia corticola]OJD29836.1 opt family small oligopeptide transporter [Diplodia corticola]